MSNVITIVGLGPGDPALITRQAWQVLEQAKHVYLRTSQHPCVQDLPQGPTYHSFDAIYEQCETFDAVYEAITQEVIALAQKEGAVVYAVPGDPRVGEMTTQRICEQAPAYGIIVRLVAGVSFLEPTFHALGIDPLDGLQICDATMLAQRLHPPLDPDVAALVAQLYDRTLAADVKLTLLNLYPEEHPVKLVLHAGLPDEAVRSMPLYEIDRQPDLDHLCSLYIPPLAAPGSLSSYQEIVARLRAPDGCPWDREQTHASLRNTLLEETYEVLEALDREDMQALCEELGDLLLQVLLHAQIAAEDGDFRLIDSVQYAIKKLIRRHPHVFGDEKVGNAEEVLLNWEKIKREERGQGDEGGSSSMLTSISSALPALAQAMAIQSRVARVGFDWPTLEGVVAKLKEEIDEFLQAPDEATRAAELGDLLFSVVNLARWYGIDAESALREANARFRRRFAHLEAEAQRLGVPLEEMSLEEMDHLWEQAKSDEASPGAPS